MTVSTTAEKTYESLLMRDKNIPGGLRNLEDGADEGLTTGNPALDDRYVIEGSPKNVKVLLSPDVQSALMDVEVPGEFVVTGKRVVYRVPFTRLTPNELGLAAEAVAVVAERLERMGRGEVSPTA